MDRFEAAGWDRFLTAAELAYIRSGREEDLHPSQTSDTPLPAHLLDRSPDESPRVSNNETPRRRMPTFAQSMDKLVDDMFARRDHLVAEQSTDLGKKMTRMAHTFVSEGVRERCNRFLAEHGSWETEYECKRWAGETCLWYKSRMDLFEQQLFMGDFVEALSQPTDGEEETSDAELEQLVGALFSLIDMFQPRVW